MNIAERENKIAERLIEADAVRLFAEQPFQWTSGWLSPVYCDNRRLLSFPDIRREIVNAFCELIPSGTDVIAGVSTAGIAWAAWIAEKLNLPMVYVRSEAKAHGLGKQVEGILLPDQRVVVIEDLISTGKSSGQVVSALKRQDAQVIKLISIFNYGFFQAEERFAVVGVPFTSLTNLKALTHVLITRNLVKPDMWAVLDEWRAAPDRWGKADS
jgi:orotate phosphoribosyltransferase